jgi:hypothetical protein
MEGKKEKTTIRLNEEDLEDLIAAIIIARSNIKNSIKKEDTDTESLKMIHLSERLFKLNSKLGGYISVIRMKRRKAESNDIR